MDVASMDQKTMVNSKGNSETQARTVEVAKDIPTNSLEKMLGADAYSEFPASTTLAFETYSQRRDDISGALGNRDKVQS